MRAGPVLVALLLLSVATGGCLDPFRPIVPQDVLESGAAVWVVTETPLKSHGTFGPNIVETEYRYDPPGNAANTPGLLLVIGIRTASKISTGDLLERTRGILDQALADEGVTVSGNELTGERETLGGSPTEWFTLTGTAQAGSTLFAGQEEVKVIGEAWYNGRSKTHVVAVGLAQTTVTNFIGQETRDHTIWNQIVGDVAGTIDGAKHQQGFIVHVQSHH